MTLIREHTFPWPKPPLSMNDRHHPMRKAQLTAQIRRETAAAFKGLGAFEHVTVTLTWTVKDKRRRDSENPVATLKPICDGLVDAGLVPDDTPNWMTKHMPVIEYAPDREPGVRITITTP